MTKDIQHGLLWQAYTLYSFPSYLKLAQVYNKHPHYHYVYRLISIGSKSNRALIHENMRKVMMSRLTRKKRLSEEVAAIIVAYHGEPVFYYGIIDERNVYGVDLGNDVVYTCKEDDRDHKWDYNKYFKEYPGNARKTDEDAQGWFWEGLDLNIK